jgi:hypothetical protein
MSESISTVSTICNGWIVQTPSFKEGARANAKIKMGQGIGPEHYSGTHTQLSRWNCLPILIAAILTATVSSPSGRLLLERVWSLICHYRHIGLFEDQQVAFG